MPRIARISIDYARFSDFEPSTSLQAPPADVLPLNSREFVRYCLINRDFPNLNHLNDPVYLAYEGGFITQGDKINVKHSDFSIKGPANSDTSGNFVSEREGYFYNNVNLLSLTNVPQKAINIRRISQGQVGVNEIYGSIISAEGLNREPLAIGDFKRFLYVPGMITFYNGTLQSLRRDMPFWRFCGRPDAGQSVEVTYPNGGTDTITIPDLFGKFIPGAQPEDNHTVTGTYSYKTGNTGGHDAIRVTSGEMATHNHNIRFNFDAGSPHLQLNGVRDDAPRFISGGGNLSFNNSNYARCINGINERFMEDMTCIANSCGSTGHRCDQDTCSDDKKCFNSKCSCTRTCKSGGCQQGPALTSADVNNVLVSVAVDEYARRTIVTNYDPPRITSQTENFRGGTDAHENRPNYYGLIPIIYVGRPRA